MSEVQKCPNLIRGEGAAFFKNVWNSKMSQFGKKGGSAFFKNVWNSKMSQRSEGGEGSTLIGTLSQIFSIFYFDGSPKGSLHKKKPEIYWSFTNRGVHPPPFRRIGNFRFFPPLFSVFFWNFKMIIYSPWNGFCMIQRTRQQSTGLSTLNEKERKAYVWTFGSINHTEVYFSPIQ